MWIGKTAQFPYRREPDQRPGHHHLRRGCRRAPGITAEKRPVVSTHGANSGESTARKCLSSSSKRLTSPAFHCTATRYAWAERAKTVGMPERFAQQALGHSSRPSRKLTPKKAQVIVPSTGRSYEREGKSTQCPAPALAAVPTHNRARNQRRKHRRIRRPP